MKKLTKEKRNQLIAVCCLTGAVLAGLWFCLITPLKQNLRGLAGRKTELLRKLDQVNLAVKNADRVAAELAEAGAGLEKLENCMASGDLYAWAINTIREFKGSSYKIDIPQFSQIEGPRDATLLPQFPYKQATLTIGGTGPFYEFGRFISDFENRFPYARLLNLTLEPAPTLTGAAEEKLAFKLDIVFLVKPDAT